MLVALASAAALVTGAGVAFADGAPLAGSHAPTADRDTSSTDAGFDSRRDDTDADADDTDDTDTDTASRNAPSTELPVNNLLTQLGL